MIEDPPEWPQFWSKQVGAKLEDGLREAPGYIPFGIVGYLIGWVDRVQPACWK